ncbi:MAG: xanthine dehydrogenase family protein molybdopterin-binding subunit [Candidatus Eremiobacteraeota bacterium]|nr:xanthine dehydrogenase family protein molybdopterin-binding subunit [Candidatus Eremiobacteraeota bacterium]MCW5868602.1 xanthine dehydrogenase family protein molybdopterin-binding subunit [Candidatus Eremiobacteraeota bacterium]
MKFTAPAGPNPIDQGKVIGHPHDRIDGRAKVTGTAAYAYERNQLAPNAAYGVMVGSTIATGKITRIDTSRAEAAPGVLGVVTYKNAGKLRKARSHAARLLAGPQVEHFDQSVALVVAETFEQARHAAKLVRVDYAPVQGRYDLAAEKANAKVPKAGQFGPSDSQTGDFESAFGRAPVTVDSTFTTPDQSHMMMEPHASIAAWHGDQLLLWTSNQMIAWAVHDTSEILGIRPEKIHVSSPFIGGGFGGKLWVRSDAILAALGARLIKRPVKVALTRAQVPNNTTHRPATIQRVRLGADPDGKLQAIAHESWSGNLNSFREERAGSQTRLLYAGANRLVTHRLADLDLPEGNAMRAPGEAVGHLSLEVAMDELAEKLNLDPVQLRVLNDVQYDPEKGPERPFSSRKLVECLQEGARRFGWSKRNPKPAQIRDGNWLIGLGVSSALRNNPTKESEARVRVDKHGKITVESDMTDIGTGSYTILAQTAAEMMGVPLHHVTVKLAESHYPVSCGSGGQFGGNSSASSVYAACVRLRQALAHKAGWDIEATTFEDGKMSCAGQSMPLAQAAGPKGLSAQDKIEFGDTQKKWAQSSFGAHFVEVGVHRVTGETRIRRLLGVFTAGRILNPKTARSQLIGAMAKGIGAALCEELVVDKRHGYFVNHDLAEYHVPVHADIPHTEVVILEEIDDKSSPMKAKGVGELGICGIGAAVANAIYNATGIRLRDYPFTPDKLLDHLPPV